MDRGFRSESISPPKSNPTQKNVVSHVVVCKPAVAFAQGAWCARFVVVRRRARENTSVSMSSLSPPMARARRFMSRGAMHGKGSSCERTGTGAGRDVGCPLPLPLTCVCWSLWWTAGKRAGCWGAARQGVDLQVQVRLVPVPSPPVLCAGLGPCCSVRAALSVLLRLCVSLPNGAIRMPRARVRLVLGPPSRLALRVLLCP